MAFSSGRKSLTLEELLSKVNEFTIVSHYLGVIELPSLINSPIRKDNNPSFGLYTPDGTKVKFKDFATGERGGIFDLLSRMWQLPFEEVIERIADDLYDFENKNISTKTATSGKHKIKIKEHSQIKVKIREWRKYDIEYWESYGISLDWLKYAEVYPISHKFIIKGDTTYTFGADKYAYAYIERKEGNITVKIYQPFNKLGFKWCTSTDRSVISLWTKVPLEGEKICVCSSLKDALCLWSNTGIPAIATQGEGYAMSDTAINELKRRYKEVFILLDNDAAGLVDGDKLSKQTGFTNIVLPKFNGGKDISDLYHTLQDKQQFLNFINPLFNKN